MARYTKAELEEFFYQQYEYIEALSEQLRLVKEQNELLSKENKDLQARVQGLSLARRPYLQKHR